MSPAPYAGTPPTTDSTKPTAPGAPVVSNTNANQTATVTVTASSDNVAVVGYAAFLDGSPAEWSRSATNVIPLSGVPAGEHSVVVMAFDAAGNYSDPSAATVFEIPATINTDKSISALGTFDGFVRSAIQAAVDGAGFVEFALISDSNGLFNASTDGGWEVGMIKAMQNYGTAMFASPMIGVNDNYGAAITYAAYTSNSTPLLGASSGAGNDLDNSFLDSLVHAYAYSASGALTATDRNLFSFRPPLIGGESDNWRVRLYRGEFASGGGAIQIKARLNYSPYTVLATLDDSSASTTVPAIDAEMFNELTFSASGVTGSIEVRNIAAVTTGKQFFSYCYAYRPDLDAGFSASVLSASGGWGLVNGGAARTSGSISRHLRNKGITKLANYFSKLRDRQTVYGEAPKIVIVINEGMNDRGYTTAFEFKSELKSLISYLRSAYDFVGDSASELGFILMPSHRISDAEATDSQSYLTAYSAAATEVAITEPNCAAFNLNTLATEAEGIANNWYSDGSHYHLLIAGNTELFRRGLAEVLHI